MDHPEVVWDAELQDLLQDIHNSPLYNLESLAAECLPSDVLPNNYLNSLVAEHKTVTLRVCLIVRIISKYRIIPHQYQLEATHGLEDCRDVLVNSGTGSGKTLCLIIPDLLHLHDHFTPQMTTNSTGESLIYHSPSSL
jgi:superfamily II DNA/RNA helicase